MGLAILLITPREVMNTAVVPTVGPTDSIAHVPLPGGWPVFSCLHNPSFNFIFHVLFNLIFILALHDISYF